MQYSARTGGLQAVGTVRYGLPAASWAALPRAGGRSIRPLPQVGPVPLTCADPEDAVSDPAVTVRLRARRARITSMSFAVSRPPPASSVRAAAQYRGPYTRHRHRPDLKVARS